MAAASSAMSSAVGGADGRGGSGDDGWGRAKVCDRTPVATPFEGALARIEGVEGWLTEPQARRLWTAAARLEPPARVVEIGSFQGRSTIVLASAARDGVEVVAIDPHAGNDRGPQEIAGYEAEAEDDNRRFEANLAAAGVRAQVRHVRRFSGDALGEVDGDVDLLYIDGAHRFGPARDDIVRWGGRVREGGTLLIHDSFSSIGVTLALLTTLLTSRRFRYVGRSGSLTEYRREPVRNVPANLLRQAASLPWFAWNVVLKALIAAKVLRRPWPY
jgi:predicted O-methyltransferase YrrM